MRDPKVAVLMGSASDMAAMQPAVDVLGELGGDAAPLGRVPPFGHTRDLPRQDRAGICGK